MATPIPALESAVANLREMEAHGDRDGAALERLRIGTVLANAPRLIDAIPLGDPAGITSLAISPEAKSIAVVTGRRTVRLIEVASGKQRWRLDATPNSFGMTAFGLNQAPIDIHFSNDGRRLICHAEVAGPASGLNPALDPHEIDSALIEVAAGSLVAPPKQFADFLAVDYTADGRYALLFDRHGNVQRWRTLPWAADGELVHLDGNVAPTSDGFQLQGEALLSDNGATMVLADDANLGFRSFDAAHMRLRQIVASDKGAGSRDGLGGASRWQATCHRHDIRAARGMGPQHRKDHVAENAIQRMDRAAALQRG